ncbi:hypothetical protein [uncultured Alistipes sp.]|uniref:hypothetical protein n=1 Tax=uncultured Alistipes sp. TaxID=538949 RepID=UPI00272BFF89|nr:hypothetical protein [uncultured Alistipes sp.]
MAITATILPKTCFSENLPDLKIKDCSDPATISIQIDEQSIISNVELLPDKTKTIIIYLRQLVRLIPPLFSPKQSDLKSYKPCPILKITIQRAGESLLQSCRLIPGGTRFDISDMTDFLDANFLTWQPQIIETTHTQPQFLTTAIQTGRAVRTTLYTKDGRAFTRTIWSSVQIGCHQMKADFSTLWANECSLRKLDPICYDIEGYFTVNGEVISNKPFAQRYILRPERCGETCFGFVNSLGSIDTLMMIGKMKLKPESENKTFMNREVETELSNSYTSYWEASTGYIDSPGMAAQYQDFLKSTNRWIYQNGEWLRIVVDEYKLEHTPRELNAYTFKYHLAARNERRYFERKELPDVELPVIF